MSVLEASAINKAIDLISMMEVDKYMGYLDSRKDMSQDLPESMKRMCLDVYTRVLPPMIEEGDEYAALMKAGMERLGKPMLRILMEASVLNVLAPESSSDLNVPDAWPKTVHQMLCRDRESADMLRIMAIDINMRSEYFGETDPAPSFEPDDVIDAYVRILPPMVEAGYEPAQRVKARMERPGTATFQILTERGVLGW